MCSVGGEGRDHTTHLTHKCNNKHLCICPCAQAFKICMISCAYCCHPHETLVLFSFQDNLNLCPNPGIWVVWFSLPNSTWLDYLYDFKHNIFLSCRACSMLWTTKFYIRLITVMFYIQPQSKFLYCTMQRLTRNEISVMLKCQPLLHVNTEILLLQYH